MKLHLLLSAHVSSSYSAPQAAQHQVEGVLLKGQKLLVRQDGPGLDLSRSRLLLNIKALMTRSVCEDELKPAELLTRVSSDVSVRTRRSTTS